MAEMSKIGFDSIYSFPVFLPRYYGGVILVGVGSFALHLFLGGRVIKARRAIGFPVFNYILITLSLRLLICIIQQIWNLIAYRELTRISEYLQRNLLALFSLENIPFFLSGLFIGGLYCPVCILFIDNWFRLVQRFWAAFILSDVFVIIRAIQVVVRIYIYHHYFIYFLCNFGN